MNLEKLKDTARKYEQKEDWRRAIDVYLKAIHEYETGKDQHPDLSLYNRVGDLYMKVADTSAAVRSYERAADLYTEQGFLNNAIALCGKILRVNPSRTQIYLKLAQIHARKNMVVDAKRNLIEFLERMNRAGQLDEAFQSVKIFADQFSQNEEIRLMLIDLLRAASRDEEALEQLEKMAADLEARGDRIGARRTRERMEEIESGQEPVAPTPVRGAGDGLVFLDTASLITTPSRVTPVEAAAPAGAPEGEPGAADKALEFLDLSAQAAALEPDGGPEALGLDVPPEPVSPAEAGTMLLGDIELTSVETPDVETIAPLEGFESGEVVPPADGEGVPSFDLMLEPAFDSAEIESRPLAGLELVQADGEVPIEGRAGLADEDDGESLQVEVSEAEASPLQFIAVESETETESVVAFDVAGTDAAIAGEEPADARAAEETWMAAREPIADAPETLAEEAVIAEFAAPEPAEVAPEPAYESPDAETPVAAGEAGADALAGLELIDVAAPAHESAAPTVAELEDRVLEDPDDPEAHRELAEALLVQGDTSRAIEELELALAGYELADDLPAVDGLLALLITLSPDAVRYYQKRVEHAYRRGDRDELLGAYLDLGDVLARLQAVDKAAAVYGRVLEHEPENARARLALQLIGVLDAPAEEPVTEAPAARPSEPAPPAVATPAPAAQVPPFVPREPEPEPADVEPADERARESVPASGHVENGFVDLGTLIMEPEQPRDTRMTGKQLEPSGDEDRDFREMLAQFRKGIEDNVAFDDYEAHYDLGVAFKEMGLYDEAVAEFQKALRAPEGRLRTSEALGVCFYEKGQVPVAEAVLRRAVEALPGGDEEKIGLIYWLGRACEAQGKGADARRLYERALAVDIRFMDINERVNRLTTERQ